MGNQSVSFDSSRWKATPSERWVGGNLRYQMREGARDALAGKNLKEVEALLGEPDAIQTFDKPSPIASVYRYDLGATRQPIQFWEIDERYFLSIHIDREHNVLSAVIRKEKP